MNTKTTECWFDNAGLKCHGQGMPTRSVFSCVVTAFLLSLTIETASAHSTGETYVWLNVEENGITGRVEINLDDLREKLQLPVPESGDARLEYLHENRDKVVDYIQSNFRIEAAGQQVPIDFTSITLLDLASEEGVYAQYLYATPEFAVPDKVTITNRLFVDDDVFHRSLVCIERNVKTDDEIPFEFVALIFAAYDGEQELDLTSIESLLRPKQFIWQGVLHIWFGLDHVLFIITLLLPAVLIYQDATWKPVPEFKTAFWNILKIVTLFTVAHSITLSLAALQIVSLPGWFVESVIALSIILVAMNTFLQRSQRATWLIIFGFGLFHGLGFASVMSDLPFRMVHLIKVLIGFNIGVELGQLAIVAVVFPVIYLLRKKSLYTSLILRGGSLATALVACVWFMERAFAM